MSNLTNSQCSQLDKLHMCEQEFVCELVEAGSTFDTAMKLLAKQNETFGPPVITTTKLHKGLEWVEANWKVPETPP